MSVEPNKIYYIMNGNATTRRLNLYSSGSLANGMNVVLWTNDNSAEQKWFFDGERLYPETEGNNQYHKYCLDRYTDLEYTNNADIWSKGTSTGLNNAQIIEIIDNSVYKRIRLKTKINGEYYYLTAGSNTNGNATAAGKQAGAAGNVYWAKEITNASDLMKQKWVFTEVGGDTTDDGTEETEDYPEGYYRFSQNTYYLNGTNTSLTAKTRNGEKEQIWHYKNGKLFVEADVEKNLNYESDEYGISNTSTPTMSTSPIDVTLIYASETTCYIKLNGTNKYLNTNGTSIQWSTTNNPWTIERIIKKTGTPRYNPEYFSAVCGENDGYWSPTRTATLKSLFTKIYKNHTGTVTDRKIGACLYGAMYGNIDGVKGKFHTGVDINDGDERNKYEISSPISGYIVNANQSNGSVCVYNNDESGNEYTIVFMHMEIYSDIKGIASTTCSDNNKIAVDRPLGKQSGYSGWDPEAYDSHLHIEIHKGKYTGNGAALPEKSYSALGTTVSPYGYFAEIVNA